MTTNKNNVGQKLELHKINGKVQTGTWVLQYLKYRRFEIHAGDIRPTPPLLQRALL